MPKQKMQEPPASAPLQRKESQLRPPTPDSNIEKPGPFSAVEAGKSHPNADSSPTGMSGSFPGTPNVFGRDLQEGEMLIELQAPPWGSDIEDSRKRYPLPLFPAPWNGITNEPYWTGDEKTDYIHSILDWCFPQAQSREEGKKQERAALEMWKDRKNETIRHWLHWSSARGAYLIAGVTSREDSEEVDKTLLPPQPEGQQCEYLDGKEFELPATGAFFPDKSRKTGHQPRNSFSLLVGGKGEDWEPPEPGETME